ncbi:Ig-like domain-containing protein, partial [Alloalcanivorax xenomutans]|uniref:Ig-like domain-containing protein n=1 Tax=Alloalcanivorax xenomutans TaxID=1094342 RepID=UPI003C60FDD5
PGNDANDAQRQSLLYAYPDDGQSEVAIPAPVVLRFSSDIELAAAENNIKLRLGGADGDIVPVTYSKVEADGRSILLTPTEKLQPLTDYTVTLRGVQLSVGKAPNRDIHFTTRALQRGPKSLVVADDDFTLTRAIPSGDVEEPVMDFSTFRFQFTQPIDPTSARYGLNPGDGTTPADTVALVDGSGELVEARLLTEGPYMTLDPAPEHLTPGETYTLTLGDGLASTFGNTFGGHELTVTPQDSSPRGEPAILVQRITDSENRTRTSPLTGKPVNEVPVNATLLGQDNVTQASGDVRAELGDVTVYPDVTPVRIPADTILSGTSLDVLIGGEVPAGFESGEVKMHFLSDATGYLVPNPYDTHNRADALRIVRLFMDVAITTDEARANGGFTQDMLHIELIGVGEVDPQEGVLKIDAVSVVEPDVLGQEFAHGMLSFQLESYKDQLNAPAPVPDTTPLEFQSWTLGIDGQTGLDKTAMFKPTDPIVLNFTRPLDRQSVTGKVHLYKNEGGVQTEVDSKVTVDGAAIVIKPVDPLEHPTETGPSLSYQVSLDPGIMDLRGEPWVGSFDETVELGMLVEEAEVFLLQFRFGQGTVPVSQGVQPVQEKSPFIMGVYPGYPCPLNTATRDLTPTAGQPMLAGRCRGGMQPNNPTDNIPGQDGLGSLNPLPADDILPVPDMPANRPIMVVFSKAIDPNSLFDTQGNTVNFKVHEIAPENPDIDGKEVPGQVSLNGNTLKFIPNTPWEEGQTYSYRLVSNGDMTSSIAQCDANQPASSLCSLDGLPVNTQLLAEVSTHDHSSITTAPWPPVYTDHYIWQESSPSLTGGGPDLVQYFVGAPSSRNVLQLLRLPQTVDKNVNLINDSTISTSNVLTGASQDDAEFPAYQIDETAHIDWQPDGSTADLVDPIHTPDQPTPLDPNGVLPPPNSAKILSSFFGYRTVAQIDDSILAFGASQLGLGQSANSAGANVGCGWTDTAPFEDQTDCDIYGKGFFGKTCYYATPAECPEDKFTYLHGVLFAEVTDEVSSNGGIKVRIYPGHIVTTSFRVYTKSALGDENEIVDSGYQVMRMRYPSGEQYIEGKISPGVGPNNKPELSTTVDLYMDAPYLVTDLTEVKSWMNDMNHNLYSYPVQMSLSGGIEFLSDGRMVVEQFNDNPIEIHQRANLPLTHVDFLVPKRGSYLRYISEPIK